MHLLERRTGWLRSLALVLAVAGVLIGLLAMHVLGLHGVQRDSVGPAPHSHEHGHPRDPVVTVTGVAAALQATPDEDCCEHGHGMQMLVLCLALLAVAVGVLAGLIGRGQDGPAMRVPARAAMLPRSGARVRAGPTYLWCFSVIRC